MPIYGYRCSECGHELEILQSMSAEPLRVCPQCGGPLKKMLYPVGVQFKGSGFYTTDYKNGGGKSTTRDSGSSDGASKEGGAAGGGGSSETPAKSDKAEKKTEGAAGKE